MKGAGRLVALTSISIGPPAMQMEGFNRNNPYCTGVVELDEGPRVVARIEDVGPGAISSTAHSMAWAWGCCLT